MISKRNASRFIFISLAIGTDSMYSMSTKKFAVFDIDGTLIRWQLYHAVVSELAKDNLLGPKAQQTLKSYRLRWKNREHGNAFKDYERVLINIYESALKSIDPHEFDQAVERVIHEYKSQVYTYTRNLVTTLKKQGYLLLAISGSHEELVSHIAKVYGFDDYIGTTYERKDNQFTGNKFIASHNKKISLDRLVQKHQLTYVRSIAVGDSKGDIVMLDMVENPIAFNPDNDLFEYAKKNSWHIVIERKNVIYKLEPDNGKFVLA
jgi:HAD superfamily hydrolase (TIGR01490 family)